MPDRSLEPKIVAARKARSLKSGLAHIAFAALITAALAPFSGCAGEAEGPVGRSVERATPPPVKPSPGSKDFVAFESGQVRPLAISPDGTKLFATNTPDNHLEIYNIDPSRGDLAYLASVRVGLEPVAVAARSNTEVWVVNHLSDSVSIVDVSGVPRVKRTLLVGDEPRDIVFAANGRAFITTAHRGQHRTDPSLAFVRGAGDPRLTTPGIPRADVWVFDAANLGLSLGGTPLKIVELFGDTPRALAVSPSGTTVYAGILNSGNQTTPIQAAVVCETDEPCTIAGAHYPGGDFGPTTNYAGARAPRVSLIAKYKNGAWRDLTNRDWSSAVKFTLPDKDVFAIDAATLNEVASYRGVGTTLFNMAANPVTGALYVTNTDAQNHERFEGPGVFAGRTVQGNLAHSRITVIKNGQVLPRHLNKHINYAQRPADVATQLSSIATPLGMAVSSNGTRLYVAAYGSSRVAVYDTAALENDTFDPHSAVGQQIPLLGGGPSGVLLNERFNRLYVLTRFDNAIAVVDTRSRLQVGHLPMFNPEPKRVTRGRPFLYDAVFTSSNGEASCASCHMFGDKDELSWDLGNPDDDVKTTPYPILLEQGASVLTAIEPEIDALKPTFLNGTNNLRDLHPMKGPMATQTLKGMQFHGAMHWRGDRGDGVYGRDGNLTPGDARLSFKNFTVAFEDLLGRHAPLGNDEMVKFADFALELMLPPNPVRRLDNQLTEAQKRGFKFYMGCDGADSVTFLDALCTPEFQPIGAGHFSDGFYLLAIGQRCEGCHRLDPAAGFFGTDGRMSVTLLPQISKVPHLRNAYTKVGMFGAPAHDHQNAFDNGFKGEQVRGTGFMSNGSVDTMLRFFNGKVFNPRGPRDAVGFAGGDAQRKDVEEFVLAYPSDLAPIVGQQITLTNTNGFLVGERIDLLIQRANANFTSRALGTEIKECELVASGVILGVQRSWLYRPAGTAQGRFEPDDGTPALTDAQLRALALIPGHEITYTCVPPGSGVRVALDRDRDGVMNGFDRCRQDSGCSVECGGGRLDCDTVNNTCEEFTSSNSGHASEDRAQAGPGCFGGTYFAKGSMVSLGAGNQVTTLYTTSGGARFDVGKCPALTPCEIDGLNDANNCGGCGVVCDFPHAGRKCVLGSCQMGNCEAGYYDCNGSPEDGCEATFDNDPNNCGGCGRSCSYPNAVGTCAFRTCSLTQCNPGYAACNVDLRDGCETNIDSDINNCGGCLRVCPQFPNAHTGCVQGSCMLRGCHDGYYDCDKSSANGCESRVQCP